MLGKVSGRGRFGEQTWKLVRQLHKFSSLFISKIGSNSHIMDKPLWSVSSNLYKSASTSVSPSSPCTATGDTSAGSFRSAKYFLRGFAWLTLSLPLTCLSLQQRWLQKALSTALVTCCGLLVTVRVPCLVAGTSDPFSFEPNNCHSIGHAAHYSYQAYSAYQASTDLLCSFLLHVLAFHTGNTTYDWHDSWLLYALSHCTCSTETD